MTNKFELKIDLNILNHLGLNLYSNVPAVLSELIANSWDADSTEVNIIISNSNDEIKIEDNGCGMSLEDINSKFLNVGYQRRKDILNDLTPKLNRQVMGRKGIGKLSIFSIAENIEVITKNDKDCLGLSMKVADIKKKIESEEAYHPQEITIDEKNKIKSETGTTIILREIKKRVTTSIDSNLRKRISRRFDIWSDKFQVVLKGKPITIEDRDYFHKLEFTTNYGKYKVDKFKHLEKRKFCLRSNKIDGHEIVGWIGLAKESGSLEDDDNLNKISILSRGKVALENVLDLYRLGGLYTKFLIGEIRADFLDATEYDDIATSDRQDYIQNDERFLLLKDFIKTELKFLQTERVRYKEDEAEKKAREIPAINEWFDSLKNDTKKAAKRLFGKINTIAIDEQHQKTLYKHGVLAFEHLRHKEKLQEIEGLDINNLEAAVTLFSQLDDIEASWYYEITKGRLEIINTLCEHIDSNALEIVLQEYIYNHLWLLDPSWEKATETPRLEERVVNEFKKISEKLTEEEKNGRIDIRYKKTSGKHIIIELKRASVSVQKGALSDQINKYKSALKKQLREAKQDGGIECICLLGKLPQGWHDNVAKQAGENALAAEDIRVVTYEALIKDAQGMYRDYLNKQKDKGRISLLLEEIDKV